MITPLKKIFCIVKVFFASLFGQVRWTSPPWLRFVYYKAQTRPRLFWTLTSFLVLLMACLVYGSYWYLHLPQPQYITAQITPPNVTPAEETLIPDKLTINFGYAGKEFLAQSVAPLHLINKKITRGVEIKPHVEGNWTWVNDSRLLFTPKEDWPPSQEYTLSFAKDFFTQPKKMQTWKYSFSTKPFAAQITDFKLYQDPIHEKNRYAVATIHFNFPVDSQSLENNTTLTLQALKKNKQDLASESYQFKVTYDKHHRTAYLHSEPLSIPKMSRFLVLTLNKGIESASKTSETAKVLHKNLLIPDNESYFKIQKISASIIRDEEGKPDQVLNIETTLGVSETQLNKSLHVFLLPRNYPATDSEEEKENYYWEAPGEVTPKILGLSSELPLQPVAAEHQYAPLHGYKFHAKASRFLYIKIDKGLHGFGGFNLTNDYVAIVKVPEFPKEITFLHKGALLALNSEKKLSVVVRGVPAVKFKIARVLPEDINQLITQTEGDFNAPSFINASFNQQNISELFSEVKTFPSDLSKQHYAALDLTKYLTTKTNLDGPQGLFLLEATGWDVKNNFSLDVTAKRLVLVTDMSMFVKNNNDGSHDVFIQSITTGQPVLNSQVTVLGKNGLPILTRTTDEKGEVSFPSLKDFIDEREPVVYLARNASDVSFLPYNNATRQLNFSRFDVGGIYSNQELNNLSAFLFADRGIYRPGDKVHLAMIVKQGYAESPPTGLPVEVIVTDPRGTTIVDKTYRLDSTGLVSFDFDTQATSPTGAYAINLYTIKDEHLESLLGSTTVKVAEFLPDRLRIMAKLFPDNQKGWLLPIDLRAKINLWNLYGAPATKRRVSGKMVLTPQVVKFDSYPDYIFLDPLLDPNKPAKTYTEKLADETTNERGEVQFKPNLEQFSEATYQLSFFAEGFEAEGGRSVTAQVNALISPLPYFIGYKAEGDLSFVKQNSELEVNFLAINPNLQPISQEALKIQVYSLHPVSTLVKKPDGTYQYQSIIQSTLISTIPFAVAKEGTTYRLPTDKPGEFAINIINEKNTLLNRFKYTVAGSTQVPLARNAELSVKLNKETYKPGEEIELQITAPYTGAGLITLERDKVYATQWFQTNTTSSLQKIHIPDNFEGTGYVNVAFVRDWHSPEIFISPLSYRVVPFKVENADRALHIQLTVPEKVHPKENLNINYQTDKPAKIIVFAVDAGILQVTNYAPPDPLAFFFQKRALEVTTQQTADQILPDYIQSRELSAVGGDSGETLLASHLNPFKRKTDLPVVYWSGILEADSTLRQVTYPIPDYFNGTLVIMAVAVADNALGSAEKKLEVRGDFVINPNAPTFVAPGDEFGVTASIANNIEKSGEKPSIGVQLKVTPQLEIIGPATQTLIISEKHEETVRFKVKAKSLGAAKLTFTTHYENKVGEMATTLSVRPLAPFMTSIQSGQSSKTLTLPVNPNFYNEYHHAEIVAATSPLILVNGLQRYLDNFPYGCTEQLVSKAFPLLVMSKKSWFPEQARIQEKIDATIQHLGERQRSNGGFSYWPNDDVDDVNSLFASIYAMHFLTLARDAHYSVPNNLFYAGIGYLKEGAGQTPTSFEKARLQAYAIYILTRNEIVTSNYLTNLQLNLEQTYAKQWQQDITGAFLASTYQLLQNHDEAARLITHFKIENKAIEETSFYNTTIADAQYLYLLAEHFPQKLLAVSDTLINSLVAAINSEEINTVLSSYTSLALNAYTSGSEDKALNASITVFDKNQQKDTITAKDNNFIKVPLDSTVTQIELANHEKQTFFYQLTEAGFNKNASTEKITQGIEAFREYQLEQNVVNDVTLGDEIEVHIQVRALTDRTLNNIAIVDLLPGGFEVVNESLHNNNVDYVDAREDRVIFFTSLTPETTEIVYKIKAVNSGKFFVPAIVAESLYDPAVKAVGLTGTIEVHSR